jgi:GNAT superfamily N-acetyltransferase
LVVRPVSSRRDRREFVELPYRLHATSAQWVPPLRLERRLFLSPRFGAFFKHGEAQLFLAERDGRVVGRISAHVDHAYNDHHGALWGWFGFFEAEEDPEATEALLAAAEAWLRARGMDRMVGPADFTMLDESGIVIEGHELTPMVRQPWHPRYYQRLVEGAGMAKAMDLFMWELEISDREKMLPVMFDLAAAAQDTHGVTLRKMSRLHLRRELDLFGELYNDAWKRNWGFVPLTKADLDQYAHEMQLVFAKKWFMVAEKDGEAIGLAITTPDVNQVLRKMKGRLLPFGWWHFLRKAKTIDRVRVGFLGVRPHMQHTGVAAQLYVEHFDMAEADPLIKGGEMGWILETNKAMNRGMEAMNGRLVKKYRVYERLFAPGADA